MCPSRPRPIRRAARRTPIGSQRPTPSTRRIVGCACASSTPCSRRPTAGRPPSPMCSPTWSRTTWCARAASSATSPDFPTASPMRRFERQRSRPASAKRSRRSKRATPCRSPVSPRPRSSTARGTRATPACASPAPSRRRFAPSTSRCSPARRSTPGHSRKPRSGSTTPSGRRPPPRALPPPRASTARGASSSMAPSCSRHRSCSRVFAATAPPMRATCCRPTSSASRSAGS